MATQAHKDKRIKAAEKRIEEARAKRDKAIEQQTEAQRSLDHETQQLEWLKSMPVDDDATDDTGDSQSEQDPVDVQPDGTVR